MQRCDWAKTDDQLMLDYHDYEWGTPEHNSIKLFELLSLEIFQAGLSWKIVLNKRSSFRRAFKQFDISKVALMNENDIDLLLNDKDIIRNKRKILATINNAQIIENKLPKGDFSNYIWSFTDKHSINHNYSAASQMPKYDDLALLVSKNMKKIGFKFTGPVIIYSFLEACGIIDDHQINCFKYKKNV